MKRIVSKFIFLIAVFIVSYVIFSVFSNYTLYKYKINSKLYGEIIERNNLIADILPPPEYIIESYLIVNLAITDTNQNYDDISKKISKCKNDYYIRHDFWNKTLETDDIRVEMVENSYKYANEFFNIIENKFLPALKIKDFYTCNLLLNNELKDNYEKHREAIDKVVLLANKQNSTLEGLAKNKIKTNSIILVLLSIVFLAIIIIISIPLLLNLKRGIKQIQQRMSDIAQGKGDLTKHIDIPKDDEIGKLASTINKFISQQRTMISIVKSNTIVVNKSVSNIFESINQLSFSFDKVTKQSLDIAGGTEQLSSNIHTIASSVEELSMNIKNVADFSKKISDSMSFISTSTEKLTIMFEQITVKTKDASAISQTARSYTINASETISILGNASKEIGQVTAIIKHIAQQTNLLALNATIQAAGAGEAGKGFTVVANEIKELANQSSKAADDIDNRIKSLQDNTLATVDVMNQVTDFIKKINDSILFISDQVQVEIKNVQGFFVNVTDVSKGAYSIAASIDEMAIGTNDISKNINEASNASLIISSGIHEISNFVQNTNNSTETLNSDSNNLNKVSEELKNIVNEFII